LRTVSILGSTGSIGTQALQVIRENPDLRVLALAAGSRWETALSQAKEFGARLLALSDEEAAAKALRAKDSFGLSGLEIMAGAQGVQKAASLADVEVVLHAIPGFEGVRPLFSSLEHGKRVAFAGKESLVSAGELLRPYITAKPDRFIPVDSEHSAIFQCLQGESPEDVHEIVLTASGGALRERTLYEMREVTPEEVLKHPTWKMGKKVTVDSATLFNKTLEVMEAHYLFGLDYDRIRVVIHKQSIVHSMVTYKDGSTKAQLARPDMRVPISYGLTYPARAEGSVRPLSPYLGTLTFEEPDTDRFPSLLLGYRAGRMGGCAPCVLSAADEVLVQGFLEGRVRLLDMHEVLSEIMEEYHPRATASLDVLEEERDRAVSRTRELISLRRR
jgi:1-deoxy-D-xylulose-5-phosphate reductoisomerase